VTALKDFQACGALPMLALAMLLPTIPSSSHGVIAGLTFGAAASRMSGKGVQQGASGTSGTSGSSSTTPKPSGRPKGTDQPQTESAMDTISVQFDYDFTKTPACSANVKGSCVQKFVVYDISVGKPYFLFAVPVPQNAHGVVKGIMATSPRLLFAAGKHRIGVSAQMADGRESLPRECNVIIEIKPESTSSTSAAH
jgi:hypothetical protein